jgi:hypothetical protein
VRVLKVPHPTEELVKLATDIHELRGRFDEIAAPIFWELFAVPEPPQLRATRQRRA